GVSQTSGGAGAITALDLAVVAAGTVDLCQVANTVSSTFAASDTGAAAAVMFLDSSGLTVGAVAADACAARATGVTTTHGDVDRASQAGPILLAKAVSTGAASTAPVPTLSRAGVSQTSGGAGAITALDLAVVAVGTVDLCQVANTVSGTFAASNT